MAAYIKKVCVCVWVCVWERECVDKVFMAFLWVRQRRKLSMPKLTIK